MPNQYQYQLNLFMKKFLVTGGCRYVGTKLIPEQMLATQLIFWIGAL